MNIKYFILTLAIIVGLLSCQSNSKDNSKTASESTQEQSTSPSVMERNTKYGLTLLNESQIKEIEDKAKSIYANLPIIGILMFDDVLTTELTAPLEVFSKHTEQGEKLFNVITIADRYDFIVSEDGLKLFPDYTIENAPKLDVLIVPSAYDMEVQVNNSKLIDFIKLQNNNTEYTVSNCAGATLIGESGIADGLKIVTWIGGGKDLQKNYPNLKVQNDAEVSYMEDGKILSSNGNLASYISSLELLEKMSSVKHRKYVESLLYLDRLKKWNK